MINQPDLNLSQKPKLIPSLLAGFEAVANHIELIILPIALDLLLWFGPHLRIKDIVQPILANLTLPNELQSGEFAQIFSNTKEIYFVLADRFNIFSAIRTLPVGIPSLIANISPVTNPMGSPIILEARNYSSAFLIWLVVGLVGLIGSSYYYNSINRVTSSDKTQASPGSIGWQTLQLLYLTIICVLFIIIIIFPALMLVSFLTLLSPILGQIALFAGGLILIWVITPMLYTPQVIFMQHQSILKALLSSIRMVRFALPSSGLFFIAVIIIAQGLDLLWQIPKENSWFSLIGVAGHALVNTSLTAAIFIYYRDGMKWIQSIITKNNLSPATASELPKVK
jgi:hypothetical protein